MINDALSDFECAAIDTYVFADQKHRRVAIHLFPDTGANGFDHRSQAAARRAFEFSILFESG